MGPSTGSFKPRVRFLAGLRSPPQAHFSLEQMSTTLEDLVETAMLLDYNERDVVGPWC